MSEKRTDPHAPSKIDPANYVLAEPLQNALQAGPYFYLPNGGTCDHCGHFIKYGVSMVYTPTGEKVMFGDICADLIDLPNKSRIHYEIARLRKRIREQFKQERKQAEWQERREQMETDAPDVTEWFEDHDWDTETFDFLLDMRNAFDRFGSLTERQLAATRKIIAKRTEQMLRRLEQMAQEEAELAEAGPAPEGRANVYGVILSTKIKPSPFGDTRKMLVKLEDGNKVWGTVPRSIEDYVMGWRPEDQTVEADELAKRQYKGLWIRFSATFTRSDDDEHFSFFKKPHVTEVIGNA